MADGQAELGMEIAAASSEDQAERDRVREEYRKRLAEKLKDPEFRKIDGFPIGTDEAMLALSDPPCYTACPNPFIEEWLEQNAKPYNPDTDDYHREPFAADVSEGKNDPIYNAHSYHTKVPHKAVMRYILHYTDPGDVVYDGFCGTGMTGVAARMCASETEVEMLRNVAADGGKPRQEPLRTTAVGGRLCILGDLSPAATFIASAYNTRSDAGTFKLEAERLLDQVDAQCGWMYSVLHSASPGELARIADHTRTLRSADEAKSFYADLATGHSELLEPTSRLQIGRIRYVIWSEVFLCPSCGNELVFWKVAVDEANGRVIDPFTCPNCLAEASKENCERSVCSLFDDETGQVVRQTKLVPVKINYTVGKQRLERHPDPHDLALNDLIASLAVPHWFPAEPMLGKGERWGDSWRAGYHLGITHTHHFYTKRNRWTIASMLAKADSTHLRWLVTGVMQRASKQHQIAINRIGGEKAGVGGATAGHRRGTLYIPSNQIEYIPVELLRERIQAATRAFVSWNGDLPGAMISTGSATATNIPPSSVDYIFVDPPFGGNMMYSELNYLWESLLRVFTNNKPEAIESASQNKTLDDYQALMSECFQDFFRVLKPGRWMTVEFHNSANAVWHTIQKAIEHAGFMVADVRVLDKKMRTHTQRTAIGAVGKDLAISCYKPREQFERRFSELRGKPEGVIEFVRQRLSMLPVVSVASDGRIETVIERTKYLLFDRMVAYHLQRGARLPLSASEFYEMLSNEFGLPRDEMYFLPDQEARYAAVRVRTDVEPLSLFVRDERSAVQWIRARLQERQMTRGDLTTAFLQELREWDSHEPRPELADLLKEYFIQSEDGTWRVPDPQKEKDVEALRLKSLLRIFDGYTRQRTPLKIFRKEAIIEGFKHCWQTKQFGIIVLVCEKIPAKVLQEIPELVQFYDIAKDLEPEPQPQLEFTWEA